MHGVGSRRAPLLPHKQVMHGTVAQHLHWQSAQRCSAHAPLPPLHVPHLIPRPAQDVSGMLTV